MGPFVTLLFENRDTIRFQIQEMARAEKMMSDEQVQGELDIYNALLPSPGELSATLFIELTDEGALREWLPKLVGIERSVELRFGAGGHGGQVDTVRAVPEASHDEALTRPTMTASVHYIRFPFTEPTSSRDSPPAGGPGRGPPRIPPPNDPGRRHRGRIVGGFGLVTVPPLFATNYGPPGEGGGTTPTGTARSRWSPHQGEHAPSEGEFFTRVAFVRNTVRSAAFSVPGDYCPCSRVWKRI